MPRDKESYNLYQKNCRSKNRDKLKAYNKRYGRRYRIESYGLTLSQYRAIEIQQQGECAICGNLPRGGPITDQHLVVDHDHDTGEFRGLICTTCNRGMGSFDDNPVFLRQAASYLESH